MKTRTEIFDVVVCGGGLAGLCAAIASGRHGAKTALLEVHGNYQRQRIHSLPTPSTTDRLRITIKATNGDLSAAIYEVRCYA